MRPRTAFVSEAGNHLSLSIPVILFLLRVTRLIATEVWRNRNESANFVISGKIFEETSGFSSPIPEYQLFSHKNIILSRSFFY